MEKVVSMSKVSTYCVGGAHRVSQGCRVVPSFSIGTSQHFFPEPGSCCRCGTLSMTKGCLGALHKHRTSRSCSVIRWLSCLLNCSVQILPSMTPRPRIFPIHTACPQPPQKGLTWFLQSIRRVRWWYACTFKIWPLTTIMSRLTEYLTWFFFYKVIYHK